MSEPETVDAPVLARRPETIVAPPTHYLYVERRCAMCPAAIRDAMGPAMRAVREYMGAKAIRPIGPAIALYSEMDDRHVRFRAGFVIAPEDAVTGGAGVQEGVQAGVQEGVQAGVTPSIDVLHAVHVGPYEHLCDTYDQLNRRLEQIGRRMQLPCWEIYRDDQSCTPSKALRTEIFMPIVALG